MIRAEEQLKDLIVPVAVSLAIGFTIGGLKSAAPPAGVPQLPAPPLPQPGAYTVTEATSDGVPVSHEWILSECGPPCLRVWSSDPGEAWQMELSWDPGADRRRGAWVGERTLPGTRCWAGAPDEYTTAPIPSTYVLRADLTGFVNLKFSRENPSCSGEVGMRGREFTLQRARGALS